MKIDSIKRRRIERLRQLRDQIRENSPDEENGYKEMKESSRESKGWNHQYRKSPREISWDEEFDAEPEYHSSGSTGFLVKTVLSLFLLSLTYVVFKTDLPYANQAQGFITEVMNREYNFQGARAMIEKYVGIGPEFLPVLEKSTNGSQEVWHPLKDNKTYMAPVSGNISTPFIADGKGIRIAAGETSVKSLDSGWVIFVGQKQGLGQTVIIQHENETQSWYAGIEQITVVESDWVQPGQMVGQAAKGQDVYFAIEKNGQFIDPTSVIPFD